MKYYVIGTSQEGEKMVICTAAHIQYARKKALEAINFDMLAWGYSNGYHIVTAKHEKEYHSTSLFNDRPVKMKYVAGAKVKADHARAIERYENS